MIQQNEKHGGKAMLHIKENWIVHRRQLVIEELSVEWLLMLDTTERERFVKEPSRTIPKTKNNKSLKERKKERKDKKMAPKKTTQLPQTPT